MRLTQGNASVLGTQETENLNLGFKKESKTAAASSSIDKLKASNFPASILRIGSWEVTNDFVSSVCIIVVVVILVHGLLRVCVFFWQYKSRYEGDLVAKCYFAKHKLVWEVLEGGLKSKIEIQWSDIMALKANCPDNGPGTLNVVVMY
jgi:hypothetical protein